MKQGTVIIRIIILVLFLGILACFGVYIYNRPHRQHRHHHPLQLHRRGTGGLPGLLLPGRGGAGEAPTSPRCSAPRGKRWRGGRGGLVYSSAEGYEIQRQLDEAKATLEGLQYIQSRTGQSADTMALEDDIAKSITGLHSMVATEI